MSLTLSNTNFAIKNPMSLPNIPLKRELIETTDYTDDNNKIIEQNESDNSESSDLENNPTEESKAIDYSDHHPVDFIKKEFLLEFDFGNSLFRNQNLGFKNETFGNRSPFLLPTQLYKNFLASIGKRRRNVADCYSLYQRNMLFPNGLAVDTSDDENGDRITDSPDEIPVLIFVEFVHFFIDNAFFGRDASNCDSLVSPMISSVLLLGRYFRFFHMIENVLTYVIFISKLSIFYRKFSREIMSLVMQPMMNQLLKFFLFHWLYCFLWCQNAMQKIQSNK